MREEASFAKAIVERNTGNILWFHIIGPHASILIQEVINAVWSGGTIGPIMSGLPIHPALPEVIVDALRNLRAPD